MRDMLWRAYCRSSPDYCQHGKFHVVQSQLSAYSVRHRSQGCMQA